jgi:anti-sigma factor RsiW
MAEQMFTCREVEAHLAPFVDGAERPDVARVIQAHLGRCAPCREAAEHERAGRDLLVECRDQLRARAPEGLRERCACQPQAASGQPPAGSWKLGAGNWKLGAGSWFGRLVPVSMAAVLIAVAVVFVLGLNDRAQAFASGLALDHLKCFKVGDSEHPIEAMAAEQAWQHDRGWPLRVAPTDSREALELVCVRRCLSTGGITAHVMYRWHGQPLSVYVVPRDVADAGVFDPMGHQTAIWSAQGRTYAVMADGHPDGFDHIVSYVRDRTR